MALPARETTESDAPVIRVDGLVKRYAGSELLAVDGVDLEVHGGEIFGLLGPNGAGKSTTVGICTTRILPTSGTILVDGVDVVADPALAKRSIGVVTQFNTLDRSCTLRENLYFHARYFTSSRSAAAARADELLAQFQLSDRADSMPDELSGGMAQRLQLARAIAHEPRVLFLDEPTAGLDPQSRLSLWQLVRSFSEAGTTVLLTTHNMEEAERLCGRVAILDHGHILVCDTPEALKRTTGATTVVELRVKRRPEDLSARIAALPRVREVTPAPGGLHVLIEDDHEGLLPALLEAARDHELGDVRIYEPTLETVFIGLTGKALRD
jgi:ABC-2 type transport system ATP-binding protein